LNPLSQIAAEIARARRRYFAARPESWRRLRRPVVSIGNLSVGGSGKTPCVAAIAALLRERGERPAVLSRGYGREEAADGVVVVSDGRDLRADLARAGDEPLMLARQLPGVAVLVAHDRYLAGRIAERRLACSVHVLDDGFQHFGLERDLDLVVVGDAEITRPGVMPFGRLREPPDAARCADAILWTGAGETDAAAARLGVPLVFRLAMTPGPLSTMPFGGDVPQPGARVLALAGIARPERFVSGLREAGFDVGTSLLLRDHHPYRSADLSRIAAMLRSSGATCVVTTEKDMVRLLPWRPLPFALAWQGVVARIEPAGEFEAWLVAALHDREGAQESVA
jgi:tetraacyldisaccharide 4'-kinase